MPDSASIYLRVIDASANRAREALRVIEDFVRFIHDDAFLAENFKTLRHRLALNILKFPLDQRLTFRETLSDVGTQITTRSEFQRSSLQAVLDANFSRLQESLRSLEEFSKLTQPEAAHEFEQMRYAAYTLQRAVFFTFSADSANHRKLRRAAGGKLIPQNKNNWRIAEISVTSDWDQAKNGDADAFLITPDSAETVRFVRNWLGLEILIGVWVQSQEEASQKLLEGIDFLAGPKELLTVLENRTVIPFFEI